MQDFKHCLKQVGFFKKKKKKKKKKRKGPLHRYAIACVLTNLFKVLHQNDSNETSNGTITNNNIH